MNAFAAFALIAAVGLDPGATLLDLDVHSGRALVGEATPAPADADPLLLMRVSYLVGGITRDWPLAREELQHARLLPDGGLVATLANGTLLEVPADGTQPVRLDTGLIGPVAVSPDGRYLAYCQGQVPDLEVWRFDRQLGTASPVTVDMAPAWSPGVSPDGATVFFASARSGVPALWRVDGSDPPRQLTNIGADPMGPLQPTPAGVTATVVTTDRVIFNVFSSGGAGVERVDWEGRR